MPQRVRRRDAGERRGRQLAERPARRRQDDPPDLVAPPAVETLMDGVVLAVDRQDRHARAAPPRVTSAPAITSTSLLARAIVFPASIAASTASSAAGAGRGADHDIGIRMRGHRHQAVAARTPTPAP